MLRAHWVDGEGTWASLNGFNPVLLALNSQNPEATILLCCRISSGSHCLLNVHIPTSQSHVAAIFLR